MRENVYEKTMATYLSMPPGIHNDIALLTLKTPIVFDKNAKAACLPVKPIANYFGRYVTVSGWGSTDQQRTSTDKLQVLDGVKIRRMEDCNKSVTIFGLSINQFYQSISNDSLNV